MNVAVSAVKPSTVLRNAAVKISKGQWVGACAAIETQNASEAVKNRAKELFASLFKPEGASKWEFWFENGSDHAYKSEHRITALLLTADMAESVGE